MPYKSSRYPHGKSIKFPRVYEALKKDAGMDKSSAAAISNSLYNKRRLRRKVAKQKNLPLEQVHVLPGMQVRILARAS